MNNTQLLINQLQDVLTRGSLSTIDKDPRVETSCSCLINSCVLLISECGYYINVTMSLCSISYSYSFE